MNLNLKLKSKIVFGAFILQQQIQFYRQSKEK